MMKLKLDIKFRNQQDFDSFIRSLPRSFRHIEYKRLPLSKNGYEFTLTDPIQPGRPKVVLNNRQVEEIKILLQEGMSVNAISNKLGISRRKVNEIRKGESQ